MGAEWEKNWEVIVQDLSKGNSKRDVSQVKNINTGQLGVFKTLPLNASSNDRLWMAKEVLSLEKAEGNGVPRE